jgi:hypothetical protein
MADRLASLHQAVSQNHGGTGQNVLRLSFATHYLKMGSSRR